jgi:esterase/lipase superfamily enzyme
MPDFVLCARNVSGGKFGSEPGKSAYLTVPDGAAPLPEHKTGVKAWAEAVLAAAAPVPSDASGNILIFIHGFNNAQDIIMQRHRQLKSDLAGLDFKGVVLSYDWPSADTGLGYVDDRIDAKTTALQLVSDGIAVLAKYQNPDCPISVHILAHSMGAFVLREAFDDADDRKLDNNSWLVSQVMLIGGDISSNSMSAGDSSTKSLYLHCVRLTNYSNRHDQPLALSNVKRLGVASRVGRVGLPDDAPDKAVNVDCSEYWDLNHDTFHPIGDLSHSWHIGNPVFTKDMLLTIQGVDRNSMPTRRLDDGKPILKAG